MNFMKLICENAVTEHSVTFYADYLCVSTKHHNRHNGQRTRDALSLH